MQICKVTTSRLANMCAPLSFILKDAALAKNGSCFVVVFFPFWFGLNEIAAYTLLLCSVT